MNVLILVLDTNFNRFNLCLRATEIFSLVFTCRFIRKKYFPTLKIFFELAFGFGSQQRWNKFLVQTYRNIIRRLLYTDVIDNWPLDFLFSKISREIRDGIFHHLNLPSILFHFLTCKRSCDTFPTKCINCSRVGFARDILWDPFLKYFDDIEISKDNCSFFRHSMFVDLDVFTSKANDYFERYSAIRYNRHWFCYYYKEFRYCDELLCAFCSHLLRLFLNTMSSIVNKCFLSESCKQELLEVFVREAIHFFSNFIHQFNIEYFYEFFDKFEDVNKSVCYSVKKEQKFGPYIHSAFDITISMFSF